MTTVQIASRLHELVKAGDAHTAYQELFAPNAVAIEPKFPGFERVEGLENITKKVETMIDAIDTIRHRSVSEAIVTGDNHIAMSIEIDATMKDGRPFQLNEIALYEVQDGKIISEQFFY